MTDVPAVAPSCSVPNATGDPAVRIADFIDQFGKNGVLVPICTASFVPALTRIAEELGPPNPPRCLQPDVVGGTSVNPDLAAECQVVHYDSVAGGPIEVTPLPRCGSASSSGGPSCWSLGDNAVCNGVPELKVSWASAAPARQVVLVRCQ
jgi:hypothetical protein